MLAFKLISMVLILFGLRAMLSEDTIMSKMLAKSYGFFSKQEVKKIQNSNSTKIVNGYSTYDFYKYITYRDEKSCSIDDKTLQLTVSKVEASVKCILGNGIGIVDVITSFDEVIKALTPNGDSRNKSIPGNCVVMLFHTWTCPKSAQIAPHYNAFARQFPEIKIAAIDAFDFTNLSFEFGVVGVPTILLFHQGRPIFKFNNTMDLGTFVNHFYLLTNITPVSNPFKIEDIDFNGPLVLKAIQTQNDTVYLAWAFIIICGVYYFRRGPETPIPVAN